MKELTEVGAPGWHPDEQDFVLLLDGELPEKTLAAMRTHLEDCWSCRVQLEETERAISRFVSVRNLLLVRHRPLPPQGWKTFAAELKKTVHAGGRCSPLVVISSWWARVTDGWPAGMIAVPALLAVAIVFASLLPPRTATHPVTAREVLERTAVAQDRDTRGVPDAVLYQRLRVTHSVRPRHQRQDARSTVNHGSPVSQPQPAFTWEVWHDVTKDRVAQRVAHGDSVRFINPGSPVSTQPTSDYLDSVLRHWQSALKNDGLRSKLPLSADSYRFWRTQFSTSIETITERSLDDGSPAVVLITRTADQDAAATKREGLTTPSLIEAELVVRSSDWHPVEQRLRFSDGYDDQDYGLIENAYEVVTVEDLAPDIFGHALENRAFASPRPSPPVSAASTTELDEAEMQARYALHTVRSDLGEAIDIVRTPQAVQVRGLLESQARKQELVVLLSAIPHVQPNLRTVSEAVREAGPGSAPPVDDAHRAVAGQRILPAALLLQQPFEEYLKQHSGPGDVSPNQQLQDLANYAAQLSQTALLEAWALRRLAERYPAESSTSLSADQRLLLETMVHDHVVRLRQDIEDAHAKLLRPLEAITAAKVLAGVESARETDEGPVRWPALAGDLFAQVTRLDEQIQLVFGTASVPEPPAIGTTGKDEEPVQSAAELLRLLQTLRRKLPVLEHGSNEHFLGQR